MATLVQPNPRIISESKEPELDRSFWKLLLLIVVGTVWSVLAAYTFNHFLTTANYTSLLWTLILILLFLVHVVLEAVLIKNGVRRAGFLFLQCVAPLEIFYAEIFAGQGMVLLIGVAVLFVLTVVGAARGARVLLNGMTIRFSEAARTTVPLVASGIALFLAIVLFANYFGWGTFNETVGHALLDGTLRAAEPIVQLWFPKVTFDQPLKDFLANVAETEIQNQYAQAVQGVAGVPNLSELSDAQKTQLLSTAAEDMRTNLQRATGLSLDPGAPARYLIYQLISERLSGLPSGTNQLIGLGVALVFFLAARGIIALLLPLVLLLAYLIYKFLLSVGFVHISTETRTREFVVMGD